jgi:hypothetical protein
MRRLLVRGGVVLMLLASTLVAATPASARVIDDPPDDHVVIDLVAMAGSGCTPGTADVAVSPDNTAFTTIYSDYVVQAGPGISSVDGRRNCQLNVLVHAPAGHTFAVVKVDYRGYGLLGAGAIASHRANYYFQGMAESTTSNFSFPTPLDDIWIISEEVPIASVVWHPCGEQRNLNINTELRLSQGTSTETSFLAMDSTDGSIETVYHLAWQPCPS